MNWGTIQTDALRKRPRCGTLVEIQSQRGSLSFKLRRSKLNWGLLKLNGGL